MAEHNAQHNAQSGSSQTPVNRSENLAFTHIGVVAKSGDDNVTPTFNTLLEQLLTLPVQVFADSNSENLLNPDKLAADNLQLASRATLRETCDVIIVVGGDGTLLDVARMLGGVDIPLIGVNMGRLGFLVDVSPEQMTESLAAMLSGEYRQEKRFLIETQLLRQGEVQLTHRAFNDVVLHTSDVLRMLEFETYANDNFISRHRADGIIVTGPTGSTAYALSGGGPILYPSLDAIMLVPICPHTLTDRPLVLNADAVIEIAIDEQNEVPALASCDGQLNFNVAAGDRLRISRSDADVTLLHPENYDYFRILRDKLGWGRDRYRKP